MANAEIYSYTARLNDELRSSPKGKTEKIVPVMVKDPHMGLDKWVCILSRKNMQNSDGDSNEFHKHLSESKRCEVY